MAGIQEDFYMVDDWHVNEMLHSSVSKERTIHEIPMMPKFPNILAIRTIEKL